MADCLGVALGADGWHFAVLEAGGSGKIIQTRSAERVPALAGRDFFAWCEELVPRLAAGTRESACDESAVVAALRRQLIAANLAEIYYERKEFFGWDQPAAVGICHPYAVSPLVRRALPVLFDGQPIAPSPHVALDAAPPQARTGDGARLCALEAPLAACLDLAGRGIVRDPSDLLILSGTAAQPELTRVHLRCLHGQLVFRVESTQQIVAGESAADFEDRVRPVVGRIEAERPAPPRLAVYGSHLTGLAEAVARVSGLPKDNVLREDEGSLAAGAARYAASCIAQGLHGSSSQSAPWRVEHVTPRDVGLICTGRNGGAFWCQVFPRGSRLPAESKPIPVTGATPMEITLAERCDGSFGPFTWLEENVWQQNALRWFASIRTAVSEGGSDSQLVLRMNNPSGRLDYGWSEPALCAGNG